jgi:hypothetical protein
MKRLGHLTAVGVLLGIGLGLRAAALPGPAAAAPPPPPGHGRLKPIDVLPVVAQWRVDNFEPVKGWGIETFMLDPGVHYLYITYTQPDPAHPASGPALLYPSEPVPATATIGVLGDFNNSQMWEYHTDSECKDFNPPLQPGKSLYVAKKLTVPVLKVQQVKIEVFSPFALGDCKN